MIAFMIPGDPVAQGRPRATTIGGHVRMYDPAKSRGYKEYLKERAKPYAPAEPLEGPLHLTVRVYRPIPKSFSKKKTVAAEGGAIMPVTKPDIDNYVKGIKDALNKLIWKDDSQVIELIASKHYSAVPRVEVEVREWVK